MVFRARPRVDEFCQEEPLLLLLAARKAGTTNIQGRQKLPPMGAVYRQCVGGAVTGGLGELCQSRRDNSSLFLLNSDIIVLNYLRYYNNAHKHTPNKLINPWFSIGIPVVLRWYKFGLPWFFIGTPVVLYWYAVVLRWYFRNKKIFWYEFFVV